MRLISSWLAAGPPLASTDRFGGQTKRTDMKALAIASLLSIALSPVLGNEGTRIAAGDTSAGATDATASVVVTRPGAQPSAAGPAQYFTGSVRVDPLFPVREPSRVSAGSVTFEPGARSAWHTHPVGQVLIVTAGVGRVQQWGKPLQEIRPGDVVQIPPGVKHWHGAAPTTGMTHIAIQETVGGKNVDWLEKVSDEQYTR